MGCNVYFNFHKIPGTRLEMTISRYFREHGSSK
jgi:hypothetical protein